MTGTPGTWCGDRVRGGSRPRRNGHRRDHRRCAGCRRRCTAPPRRRGHAATAPPGSHHRSSEAARRAHVRPRCIGGDRLGRRRSYAWRGRYGIDRHRSYVTGAAGIQGSRDHRSITPRGSKGDVQERGSAPCARTRARGPRSGHFVRAATRRRAALGAWPPSPTGWRDRWVRRVRAAWRPGPDRRARVRPRRRARAHDARRAR